MSDVCCTCVSCQSKLTIFNKEKLTDFETSLNDLGSSSQVKIQFQTLLKEIQIFVFLCCVTREDLSIDVPITNVGPISAKPGRFLFSRYGHSGMDKIQFRQFRTLKKKTIGFPCCSTR